MSLSRVAYHGTPYAYDANTVLLNANGTYLGLISTVYHLGTIPGGTSSTIPTGILIDVSIPPAGTWRYRVLDNATAELTIDGVTSVLHFDDGKPSGFVGFVPALQNFFTGTRFSFDAYIANGRLVNCSTRCYLAPGRSVSLGFVIADASRRLLVRAIGPGLRTFGIGQPLDNLKLNVHEARFSSLPVDLGMPPSTTTTLDVAAQNAGAFPLPSPNDRAKFLTLDPGAYVADVTATDNQASGEVLIEVYALP